MRSHRRQRPIISSMSATRPSNPRVSDGKKCRNVEDRFRSEQLSCGFEIPGRLSRERVPDMIDVCVHSCALSVGVHSHTYDTLRETSGVERPGSGSSTRAVSACAVARAAEVGSRARHETTPPWKPERRGTCAFRRGRYAQPTQGDCAGADRGTSPPRMASAGHQVVNEVRVTTTTHRRYVLFRRQSARSARLTKSHPSQHDGDSGVAQSLRLRHGGLASVGQNGLFCPTPFAAAD